MIQAKIALCLLLCVVTACSQPEPQPSLVGDWPIATDQELSRDRIYLWFRKENGTDYSVTLSYALEPDGALTIEKGRDHRDCCFGDFDKHLTDGRWRSQLSAASLIEVRRALARLRPRALSKERPFALPAGCTFVDDSTPWSGISYSQGKIGGTFVFQPNCKGTAADQARSLLLTVLDDLPPVEGSHEFLTAK